MASTKRRCLRTRHSSDSDSSVEEAGNTMIQVEDASTHVVDAIREIQRVRKRRAGISIKALSVGGSTGSDTLLVSDPFKLKTGGLVVMKTGAGDNTFDDEEDVEARLAKTFATETNKRDEDAEMIKYIEEEVAKRKGLGKHATMDSECESDLLRDVPANLRPSIGKQKEDMMSNQMLCGIPEIDLGVETKMRNIEATEEAKQVLMKTRFDHRRAATNRLDGLAPTNVAVNFVQHSRWYNSAHIAQTKKSKTADTKKNDSRTTTTTPDKDTGSTENSRQMKNERKLLQSEKATDSLALQRFRKYMRDHSRR